MHGHIQMKTAGHRFTRRAAPPLSSPSGLSHATRHRPLNRFVLKMILVTYKSDVHPWAGVSADFAGLVPDLAVARVLGGCRLGRSGRSARRGPCIARRTECPDPKQLPSWSEPGRRPTRRLRVRVATATRPRTVIGIRADASTRERPRRRVMRHSRQASPHNRPMPAGDSMIPTYLIAVMRARLRGPVQRYSPGLRYMRILGGAYLTWPRQLLDTCLVAACLRHHR